MAGKRTASSDLNHDNWDRDEEPEQAGTFQKASDDVLKRRVIKTARRRGAVGTPESGDGGVEKKSIFGAFTAFAKPTADPSKVFNFLKNTESTPTNTNGMDKSEPKPLTPVKTISTNGDNSDEYYAKMKGLNESVANWIKKHVDENPFINLKPIFNDYEKYFDEIETEHTKKPAASAMFNFGASKTTATPGFSFGADKAATQSPSKDPAKPFTFGAPSSTFSFNTNATSAPFSFGRPTQTQPEPTESKETEDEDAPPKVEFTPVVEEGNTYSTDCKVFVKKDGAFGDRGIGTLYLKPIPDSEKTQLIVRANTNLGNLICNFILSSALPTQRMGKKDVMIIAMPTPDSKPPPVPVLLRVKTPEKADELLQALEKHKK